MLTRAGSDSGRCEFKSCSSQYFSVDFGSIRLSWKCSVYTDYFMWSSCLDKLATCQRSNQQAQGTCEISVINRRGHKFPTRSLAIFSFFHFIRDRIFFYRAPYWMKLFLPMKKLFCVSKWLLNFPTITWPFIYQRDFKIRPFIKNLVDMHI